MVLGFAIDFMNQYNLNLQSSLKTFLRSSHIRNYFQCHKFHSPRSVSNQSQVARIPCKTYFGQIFFYLVRMPLITKLRFRCQAGAKGVEKVEMGGK